MIKCYAITVPCLPNPETHNKEAREVAEFLGRLKGMLGLFPHNPEGTVLFFDTMDNARMARDRFMEFNNPCGDFIMNAEMSEDKKHVRVTGIAERVGPPEQ